MSKQSNRLRAATLAVLISIMGIMPTTVLAEEANVTERPTGMQMIGDTFLVRPALLAATVLGTGVFVVSLPFSALGGNVQEVANMMVVTPFKGTFMRCLGCSNKHTHQ
jgi:hypothetical protein